MKTENEADGALSGATKRCRPDIVHEDAGEEENRSSQSRKRRRFESTSVQHGSRAKGKDLGRAEWSRQPQDKRARNEAEKNKRRNIEQSDKGNDVLPQPFAKEEIEAEERRPKRKVAVLIGYSGSGYKGMQINTTEKTIEGDLFAAFVAAGAISKANADDSKKSALVRCARTDKGVHAAGNIISLKLIVEDENVVQVINSKLSPQIRVWGIERTTGSFSCYQACDSRWYEYLIPTHAFLPPHPNSYLGKKLVEMADDVGDRRGYDERQEEVASFWTDGEETYIKPLLESFDAETREWCSKALYESDVDPEAPADGEADSEDKATGKEPLVKETAQDDEVLREPQAEEKTQPASITLDVSQRRVVTAKEDEMQRGDVSPEKVHDPSKLDSGGEQAAVITLNGNVPEPAAVDEAQKHRMESAVKRIKATYISLKKSYRIDPTRLSRIREALTRFIGSSNFHNYTTQKSPHDPSATRHIKSFVLSDNSPLLIKGKNAAGDEIETEWLSLRIHGQSFMMHQIRKMVAMLALCVRCGTPLSRTVESLGQERISIPKVPGLGLLLERPVFDSYNERVVDKFGKPRIDFGKYEKEIGEFKAREIYERIWREEERGNVFHQFWSNVDNFKDGSFLWVSSAGLDAVKGRKASAARRGKTTKEQTEHAERTESETGKDLDRGKDTVALADEENQA